MRTSYRTRRSGMTLGNVLVVMLLVFFAVMTVTQVSARTVNNAFKDRDDSLTVALADAGVSEIAGREEGGRTENIRPDSLLDGVRSQVRDQWDTLVERFQASDAR